jgi:GNAT superfamily N-acetyltransferase
VSHALPDEAPDDPPPTLNALSARVLTAHADTWQAQGRLRRRFGGGTHELPGVRLMASGIEQAQWNGGDVHDVGRLEVAAVAAWYAKLADGKGLPWGLRVPEGVRISGCKLLLRQRCMAVTPERFHVLPAPGAPPAIDLELAGPADVDAVTAVDAAAFGGDAALLRRWIAPQLGAPGFTVALARLRGKPVGAATAVHTRSLAGAALGLFGVGVVPHLRRRGIATALTAWLIARGWADGATLAHLNPATDEATRLYTRLGFVETAGIDIYGGW